MGLIWTTYLPSSDPHVWAFLVVGFILITLFGIWEYYEFVKYPLCPRHIFTSDKGRDFAAPFAAGVIITMCYYSTNIIWPTMINLFYTTPTSPLSDALVLTLPANIGLCFGAFCLALFGGYVKHWKTTLTVSFALTAIFGGLMALVTPTNKSVMIAFVFLEQLAFGWAQYLVIMFGQLGVKQIDLGIAAGMLGFARYVGGTLALAIYDSILVNSQASSANSLVPPAAIAAGLPESSVPALLAALPLGASAMESVPGVSASVLAAAGNAYTLSYVKALRSELSPFSTLLWAN